ncbi:hypothetical protein [Vibrio sp. 1180_3]|uniref:hypothetical protein n=1 Tax=Vibrio sp. 1180_3 TaxID=2528832 RepID=UPI00240651BC|nr:hypothetical protein [Vibrio sp. 1180_3]MDF9398526.1 hypothetical protein [Vibrio sp. 1180_3]
MASNQSLSTGYISEVFSSLIDNADDAVAEFIKAHTGIVGDDGEFQETEDGTLILSSSDMLGLQQLMAEQSISAQTATSTLKSVKDSISASARNI